LNERLNQQQKFKDWINEKDQKGLTPAHLAACNGNIKIIELLVNYGCNLKAISNDGLTVFHVAAQNNQSIMLAYLKEHHNFRTDLCDKDNRNALHQASFFGSEDALNILLAWNLDLNK
jgi:ankyrin repeat protein